LWTFEIKKMDLTIDWAQKKSTIHIEFHFKLFIVIKHGLKNEIIKLIVNFRFVKP
jgi:hypothetical protein